MGRFQPHAAGEVFENQYGDCKDKHTLFASLLNAAGIKAYPALISSSREIDAEVPSPGQFDHVITAIPQGAEFLWLDTTTEVAPLGLLLTPLRDKHALVVTDDVPSALATTPADDPFKSLQKFEMQAKLSDTGVLEGKAEDTGRGDGEVIFRAAFRAVPVAQWKDLVQRISYARGFAGDVSEVNVGQPEKTGEPFQYSYTYKRKDYSDWPNRRITPPLPVIALPSVDEDIQPSAPIWLGSPGEIDFQATLELPKGYSPTLQKAVHIKRDFADYDATYSFNAGVITAKRRLLIKLREVPTAEYAEYRTFCKAVEDDYGTYTSLSVAGSAASKAGSYQNEIWNLPYSQNPEAARLYDDAREQYQRKDFQGEIASLKRAVEIDPKFVRAWLWLGEIYKGSWQNDQALQAYRKAIEMDPEQAISYKALGFSLIGMRKVEESVPVWQQLIKVAPENAEGYANLGMALISLKRYREAVLPLESAVKLSPDQAEWEFNLGTAYFKTGDAGKSQVAFEAALKQDSTPVMLNNVAYFLADENTDLEKAKEYAEKAVRDEEDASSKTKLSELDVSDLAHPRQLAMYWDTLGWVYYRSNNLASAEVYIKAAWMLSQNPVIGEHLGRVYEQQKKKEAALHAYQLAYSATSPRIQTTPGASPAFAVDYSELGNDIRRLGGRPVATTFLNELNEIRTFKIAHEKGTNLSAQFFVLLEPDNKTEAKFISGSDFLKDIQKTLESTKFNFKFPDERPARVLRRGMAACFEYSGCSFVLMPPDDVFSVQ